MMSSGVRPFDYMNQTFPLSGVPGTNVSGIMQNIASGLYTSGTYFVNAHHLGGAWFATIAEIRSMTDGHPSGGSYNNIVGKGVMHLGSAIAGVDPRDLPDSIIYNIPEPDPSGTAWLFAPSGIDASGQPAQIQIDAMAVYVRSLRDAQSSLFTLMANDYPDVEPSSLRQDYLIAYFPQNMGNFHDLQGPSGFYIIDLAEVQYNPYPRIAGKQQPAYEYNYHSFYTSRTGHPFWNTYTGQSFDVETIPPSNDEFNFALDTWRYHLLDNTTQHGIYDFPYYDYMHLYYNLTSSRRSSVTYDPDNSDEYLPLANELFRVFGVVDAVGPVFPACQRLNGTLSPHPSGGLFRSPTPDDWWKDGAFLGKLSGLYTLNNQGSIAYNKWSDEFGAVKSEQMDGNDSLREFCRFYYYAQPQLFDGSVWGGTAGNVAFTADAGMLMFNNLSPVLYGYDPSDLLLGYMGYYAQDYLNTVRVDGQGLISGRTRVRVIDLADRTAGGWSGCQDIVYHASSDYMVQSGCREVHYKVNYRNANAGINWIRYPVDQQYGLPSHSGEPLNSILNDSLEGVDYMAGVKDRRGWFPLPDVSSPDINRNEQSLSLVTPIFAERRNVKKIVVENDHYFMEGQGNSYPSSGQYSVWPSDELFQNGSGVGYHVMDKGIWMRKHPANCGMTLISPYNGQRLLFKRAEDGPVIWGIEEGEWRREIRANKPPSYREYTWTDITGYPGATFEYVEPYNKTAWFLNRTAAKRTDIIPWVQQYKHNLLREEGRWTGGTSFDPTMPDKIGNQVFDNVTTQLIKPYSVGDYGMYQRVFTGQRGYHVSWYRDKEEQVAHTNGTYTVFNKGAQIVRAIDGSMTRVDYLSPDDPHWWSHDPWDETEDPYGGTLSSWGADVTKYPAETGYWHYYLGGNELGGVPGGGPGNDKIPDIPFSIPELMYTPLISQCDYQGTFQAQSNSSINDYWVTDADDIGKANLFCNVDIYLAKKPWVQWDIPGLTIQNSGVATIDISNSMLSDILTEGRLAPGFTLVQGARWYYMNTWYHWETWEKFQVNPPDKVIGSVQREVAFDGYLALRLDMFGLQESSDGGIVEGWGRLVETGTGGITESIDVNKGGFFPAEEPTDHINGGPSYAIVHIIPYHPICDGYLCILYEQEAIANMAVAYWMYTHDYIIPVNMGYRSSPRFAPLQSDRRTTSLDYASPYGSRFFRVWFDVDDPSTIHCVDDIHQAGRYGLIVEDKIIRYDIVDKVTGGVFYKIRDTSENEYFLPGMNPGALSGWDPYIPPPLGSETRRQMNLDYKNAKRCPVSITWVEGEMISAVKLYEYNWGGSFTGNGQGFEIASLDINTGIFDNDRAQMFFMEPGTLWTKQRPLLESRMIYTPGTPFIEEPIWYYDDAYQYEHWKYGDWSSAYLNPYDYYYESPNYNDGLNPLPIFAYSSEVSDMWPKIVYTYI